MGENSENPGITIPSVPLENRKNLTVHSSEITNLISSFPKLKNDAVNMEVTALKSHLRDYIDAITTYNINDRVKAEANYQRSYKKLQKLRKYLNKDDDEVLNRYLVRIKINMNNLNTNLPKDSVSSFNN